jgi:hypothetical protein
MRTYEEIKADATRVTPFPNGVIGEQWMRRWCDRCKVLGSYIRNEADKGCPVILVALLYKTPKEWTKTGAQEYDCSEFVDDGTEMVTP